MQKKIFIGTDQARGILEWMLELGFTVTVHPIRGLADQVVDSYYAFTPPQDIAVEGPHLLRIDDETRGRCYVLDLTPDVSNPGEKRYLYLKVPARGDHPARLTWQRPSWVPCP